MIAVETDRLVDEYLRRLEAAAAELPRDRRAELVAVIREHIENALRGGGRRRRGRRAERARAARPARGDRGGRSPRRLPSRQDAPAVSRSPR
jgi:hypothetical protein